MGIKEIVAQQKQQGIDEWQFSVPHSFEEGRKVRHNRQEIRVSIKESSTLNSYDQRMQSLEQLLAYLLKFEVTI
jgi:hypothetical protein